MEQAFIRGDLTELAGCWQTEATRIARMSSWVSIPVLERRELCFTAQAGVTLALRRRYEAWGASVTYACPNWPGMRVTSMAGGTLRLEAPGPVGQACAQEWNRSWDVNLALARVTYRCEPVPGRADQIACTEAYARENAPDQSIEQPFILTRR